MGVTAGCGTVTPPAAVQPRAAAPAGQAPPGPVTRARVGVPAPSTRVHFVPTSVELADGSDAAVLPAATVDGRLAVPENVGHVGWWDGSAYAGDPFGSTVIAGHVDSAAEGLGYFARLLRVEPGDEVTLSDGRHRARYRVTQVTTVARRALATSSAAFDQSGDARLVLITCAGAYRAEQGGYDSNLVVTAEAIGLAR